MKTKTITPNYIGTSLGHKHSFYISGPIRSSETYIPMIHTIRNAGPNDEVVLHINSGGGDLFAALQITRAIAESQANIMASVEGICMSAATIIFLAANQYQISPHSIFMIHNYSSGAMGKGGELYDQISHERGWSKKLLKSCYKDFLSKGEIKSVLDGKDIYMNTKQIGKRLNNRLKKNSLETPAE